MNVLWGAVLTLLGGLAWAGQALAWLSSRVAARFGLTEEEAAVEPVFWADVRGEAAWDTITLWTLPVAGVLLIADESVWASFGVVGGGIYTYFGGRGILTRVAMRQRGFRIGSSENVKTTFVFLGVCAVAGMAIVIASLAELRG